MKTKAKKSPSKKAAKKAPAKKAASKKAPSKKAASKKTAKRSPAVSATLADWTILVYMAGDNNLDSFGGKDIKEMKTVGSSDRIHVVVQRDSAEAAGCSRLRVRKGTSVASDVVTSMGRTNTGDPAVLEDFLTWGLQTYPAKRTMAVLWNHGSGWDDTDIYEAARRKKLNPVKPRSLAEAASNRRAGAGRNGALFSGAGFQPAGMKRYAKHGRQRSPFFLTAWVVESVDGQRRAIAFDDDAQDFLDSVEMKEVFARVVAKTGRAFDVIGMDACLMSMVETGLQLQDSGVVMCASQEIEPGDGWPYDRILTALTANPGMDGAALTALIAKEFVAAYHPSEPVTQAACTLSDFTGVAGAANKLGKQLAAAFDTVGGTADPAVKRAVAYVRGEVQSYEHPDYVDLWDFADRLSVEHPPYASIGTEVKQAIEKCVFANHALHPQVKNSHGLSIYLPQAKEISPLYDRLDFGKDGWAAFLKNRAHMS